MTSSPDSTEPTLLQLMQSLGDTEADFEPAVMEVMPVPAIFESAPESPEPPSEAQGTAGNKHLDGKN